jgi:DNA polymerase elongation subunit (family B)
MHKTTSGNIIYGILNEQPKMGHMLNIRVIDVASLYPTMARKYNICFTTVCCECCKDDPKAKVPQEALMGGEDGTVSLERNYWICRRKKGIFPAFLDEFTELRLHFKHAAKKEPDERKAALYTVLSDGLKVLVNGGYGTFGQEYWYWADVRVAELITSLGRYTLRKLREISARYGLTVIYGDTDSAFLEGEAAIDDSVVKAFIDDANKSLLTYKLDLE